MSFRTSIGVTGTVKGTALQANSVNILELTAPATRVVTTVGISVVSMAVKAIISGLKSSANHESNVYTIAELRLQKQAISSQIITQVAGQKLSILDAQKVAAIASCTATPYKVTASAEVAQCVQQLYTAASSQQVQVAQQRLEHVLEIGNQQVLIQSLVHACSRASVKAGFEQVKVTVRDDGKRAVIATNFSGQALITEIDTTDRVNIDTEVDGVRDGSCHEIIERFEQALVEEGVIRDGAPERKPTGGVAQLDATKQARRDRFGSTNVQKKVAPTTEEQELLRIPRQQQVKTRQ
jgi:hypothetical protein